MTQLKTIFLVTVVMLTTFAVEAQITITKSHMPKSGDTIRYSEAPMTDLPDLTKTDTNYNWDFSEMGMQSQGLYEYKASFQTPYIINFGFSALGLKIADSIGSGQMALKNLYNFYKSTNTQFETVGIGFQYGSFPLPQSGKYSKKDIIYKFPLTYNDKHTNDFEAKVPITLVLVPVGDFYIKGTRTTEVDGWGKISTPYVTDEECIRIKSVIEETDSIVISTLNIDLAIPTKKIEYKWLSKSERIPILEVSGTEVLGNFVPTYIRYRDTFRTPKGIFDLTVDFKADKVSGNTNDTFKLKDETDGRVLFREWRITPSTYTFIDGTDENSKEAKVKFSKAGKYSVELWARNVVNEDSLLRTDYLDVAQGASIGDPLLQLSTNIYPNPFINTLEISLHNSEISTFVKLFDANGRLVYSSGFEPNHRIEIDTKDFEAGTYFIEIEQGDETIRHQLLKIKH